MVDSGQITSTRRGWPWWRRALTGLSALGLALSAYLGWHYLTGRSVMGCGDGGGCDQVLASQWSAVGGVLPVSALAAGTYLAMLVASLFVGPTTAAPDRRLAWAAMLVLAGAATGSAVWFVFVQVRFVGAFCPYCLATHSVSLLIAALVVRGAVRETGEKNNDAEKSASRPPAPPRSIRPLRATTLAAFGVGLAGGLAALQLGLTPRPVYRGGESPPIRTAIDPHAAPIAGSPDARYVVTLLFDYQCPHCQRLHSMLDESIRRYDGKLAFVLCPTPLNNRCNPYVTRESLEFKDSCELARIGLAVWAASHDAFPAFDRWMFSPDPGRLWRPRTPQAATEKAVELAGRAKFDAARADPRVDQYLQTSVRIFGDTAQGGNAVPKLIFGSHWVTPQPRDVDDLIKILHDTLELPRP